MLGSIWETIQSKGFCVIAAQVYRLSKEDAGEFLEVYKGVLAEYPELVDEYTSGPCVAMQIGQVRGTTASPEDPNRVPGDPSSVQQRFREWVGPMDPVRTTEHSLFYFSSRWFIKRFHRFHNCMELSATLPVMGLGLNCDFSSFNNSGNAFVQPISWKSLRFLTWTFGTIFE